MPKYSHLDENKKKNYQRYNQEYYRKWIQNNKERRNCYWKEYRKRNIDLYRLKNRQRQKNWADKNKIKIREKRKIYRYRKEYYQQKKGNILFRLNDRMRNAIWWALKKGKNGRSWEGLVGYSLKDLMIHLENQFDDKMNWENYGSYWHIAHIKPKSLFFFISSDDNEFKRCWALENLRPLEKVENMRKGDSFS